MATTNGYRPEQASDLYITRGTTSDYMYGMYRIFAYTFEMSISDYPRPSMIAPETGRNKEAVLYLIEQAGARSRARGGRPDRPLRRLRRRSRGRPGLARQPGRHRYRGTANAAGSPGPTRSRRRRPARSSSARRHPVAVRLRDRLAGGHVAERERPRRPDHRPIAGHRAAVGHRPAAVLPLCLRPRRARRARPTHSARSSRPEDGTQTLVLSVTGGPSDVDGTWQSASILMDAWAARRSTSGSRRSTADRTTSSRSRSTTSG